MNKQESAEVRNAQIIDEAAEWFVEFSSGDDDPRARRAFDAWLRMSPEHVRAYLDMLPLWQDAAAVDPSRLTGTDALVELAKASGSVVPLTPWAADRVEHARGGRRLMMAASVLFACVLTAALVWFQVVQRSTYETDVGEQRAVSLPDGSIVEINARSRIRVRFADAQRDVYLLQGQALFRVQKDAARPFVVHSGDTRIRAVGTQFDVNRSQQGTIVTVLEGRVAVMSDHAQEQVLSSSAAPPANVLVSAGEQTIVEKRAVPLAIPVNVEDATAWRERRLVFSATPLPVVAEQFNRYNERRLLILDQRLDRFLVNGTFSSTDPASLVRFLRAQPDLRVDETNEEIRISSQ
jgi:transmembrane sensor